ncbi:MAG: HD domain-containing protein [Nitriliruptoraceae bacterium]
MNRGPNDPALLATALSIAARAHAGQVDKAGNAYLAHPLRVAARVMDDGDEVVAAALLHDVLEDSELTLQDLAGAGLPPRVLEAVDRLTRRPGETHGAAVRRAAAHPMSALIKRADIADNSDPDRLALLPEELKARLSAKYARALAVLEDPERTVDGD